MSLTTSIVVLLRHPLTEKLGWALLHFVWQGAMAAALLWLVLTMLRRSAANVRYWVACTGLGLTALLPLITVLVLPDRPVAVVTAPRPELIDRFENSVTLPRVTVDDSNELGVSAEMNLQPDVAPAIDSSDAHTSQVATSKQITLAERAEVWLRPWLSSITLLWLLGVVALSIRLLVNWNRVQRLRIVGTRPVNAALEQLLQRLTHTLQIRQAVRLLESALVEVPTVIGWLRPVILLPVASIHGLTVNQLEAILAHELAHIRRADFAINVLQSLIEILLFYHPAVWWISSRIRQERENCCDDLAASISGDAAGYVAALVRMEELRAEPRELAFAARGGDLLSRVRRLLITPAPDRVSPWWLTGVVALLVVGSVVCLPVVSRSQVKDPLTVPADSDREQASVQTENAQDKPVTKSESLTPAQMADRIVETFQRFESVEYAAEIRETRNTTAYGNGKEPTLVQGTGRIRYRGDGTRWYVAKSSFSYNHGSKDTYPTEMQAAFDGSVHAYLDKQTLYIGEHDSTEQLLKPSAQFWRAGLSAEWLLSAMRRPEAKLDGETTIDGVKCQRVVVNWKPDWDKEDRTFEILLCPEQNWLIRRVVIHRGQGLVAEWIIRKVVSTSSGLWYPAEFEITRPESDDTPKYSVVVTEFRERRDFSEQDFTVPVRVGQSVVDYRQGIAWYVDPWWSELAPWLRTSLGWPQSDLKQLSELRSYNAAEMAGQSAPALQPSEWLTEPAPLEWNRSERKATVVYFFGGGLISPTPRQLKALDQLYRTYRDGGLEVIAITPSTVNRDLASRTVKELNLAIPVFIDAKASDADTQFDAKGAEYGATFAAFRQRAYTGTVLIDDEGKVVLLDLNTSSTVPHISRLEQLIREILQKTNGTSDPPLLRQKTVQKISQALRGDDATIDEIQVALNDPTLVWQQNAELKIAARTSKADREMFKAHGWTEQALLENLLKAHGWTKNPTDESDRLPQASLIRLEEEWKRRRVAASGTGSISGMVRVKGTNPKATITIEPRLRLMSSNNAASFLVLVDRARNQTVETNEQGQFEIPRLPKGTYEVTIGAAGLARTTRTVDLLANDSRHQLTVDLSQGDSIKGRVVDARGNAVVNANVMPLYRHVPSDLPHVHTTENVSRRAATSDKTGGFVFESLYDGDYVFEVHAEGFEPLTTERLPAGTQNAKFVLKPINQTQREKSRTSITGLVLDRETRTPITNAEVGLQIWDERRSSGRNSGPIAVATTTDDNGQYTLEVPADAKDEAEFAVWANKDGYQMGRENLVQWLRDVSENPPLLLTRTRGCWILLADGSGKRVAGTKVAIEEQTLHESISFPIPDNWRDKVTGTTDASGTITIPHVVPDAVTRVRLVVPGWDSQLLLVEDFFLNHRPNRKGPHFAWMLPKTGTLEGQLKVDGGTLPENLELELVTESSLTKPAPKETKNNSALAAVTRFFGSPKNRSEIGVQGVAKVRVDADGRFRVQSLPAGRLAIKPFLDADQPLRVDLRKRMDVVARESTAIEISVTKGVRIRGAITESDTGRGHAGVRFQAIYGQAVREQQLAGDELELTTDQDGRFEFWAPPGPIVLVIGTRGERYSSVEWWSDRVRGRGSMFNIPDTDEFELDPIVFVPTATAAGRLVDADGKPLEGWSIYGYPDIPGKRKELVSNCLVATTFEGNGRFSGRYPSTLAPVFWKATHEKWRTPYESLDQQFDAIVVSKDPLVLQIDTKGPRKSYR